MGKYDAQIERSKRRLVEAEKNYSDAVIKMADAAPSVRELVLDIRRKDIKEAKNMIATFESAND